MNNPLPPWARRDNFSVNAHQRQNDLINSVASLFGSGTIGVAASPFGRTLLDTRNLEVTGLLFGEITDTGPIGTEDDFDEDDDRYWVRIKRVEATRQNYDGDADPDGYLLASLADDDAPPGDHTTQPNGDVAAPLTVVATDLFSDATEPLEGPVILLECFARDGTAREKVYILLQPGAGGGSAVGFWFNISGVAAVGKYWAKAIVPLGTPIDPAADISFGSDFGLMPGDTVLLINAAELSNDTGIPWLSELMDDHIFFATPWGETNEDPPKGVWMIHGVHNGPCTA